MGFLEALRRQGAACAELGSPMYADLLGALSDDVELRGTASPVAAVLAGHERDPDDSALALRLLGSVHRLVLERRAGDLAAYYPSVGGRWEPVAGAESFLRLLEREPVAVRAWLDRPPQTNEVGRAAALVGGLLRLRAARLPVRLFEIGSSGGLNLLADRFAYGDDRGRWWGDPASPVSLRDAWSGAPTGPEGELRVVARRGSDLHPVDVGTTEGRLRLTAYVWPDQADRLARLRGALALARQEAPVVDASDAVAFVRAIDLVRGTATVLWHSVMWQYLPATAQAAVAGRVAALGSQASPDAPFVHLRLEPEPRTPGGDREFLVVARAWPGGERQELGVAAPHGVPVVWGSPGG